MGTNKQKAAENFMEKRYNCCQSVVCAYCGKFGVSEKDVFRMTEGFGLGMGGLMDTCGAVTGMFLVIGLANSAGDMDKPLLTKMDTYEKLRTAAKLFREKKGSVYCRDLLTQKGPQPLPCCAECVETAIEVLDEMGVGNR